ncbi:hypothetical protein [Aliarcobacter cryaerophilus]|uniref:hypothetical protein n=1 Tax=Aliarcobacter cryaerophilus TaxID=28198 RepID=UPI0021B2E048|nr:hypothetical protein [Aliarcobacter cryaerophilus]MCT7508702.1 hypothetical protein [Aliarcobacter cryaerophilus]
MGKNKEINVVNTFENNEIDTAFDFKGSSIENQTNITVISNKSISKKLNKDIVEFKAHSLANYSPHWIILRNASLLLLIIAIIGTNYIYVPVGSSEISILKFLIFVGTLCAFFFLYTVIFVKVQLSNDFIKVKGKDYHFDKIRKMKFCRSFFYFGKHIKIYLENDKYPSLTLYLNNGDDIDLIEEFYLDYLKNTKKKNNT